MRTTVLAVTFLAVALTTPTRAQAQGLGGTNVGFGIDTGTLVGVFLTPSAALTLSVLIMDAAMLDQLAERQTPRRGLAITSLALATASAAWAGVVLAHVPLEAWKTEPGIPAAVIGLIALNSASAILSVATFGMGRPAPIAVMPVVTPGGGSVSVALRW